MDNKKLSELKEKYGEVILVKVPDLQNLDDDRGDPVTLEFVFHKPKSRDIERFLKEMSKDVSRAMKNLCFGLVVEEMKGELERALEKYPAIHTGIANSILDRMGMSDAIELKNL
ncbi:hypothetical protein MGLY_10500 [Neomoorella glycerini]|jgi:hypothetical protein|uniref:DUF6848 domain-containing protein n=1 Tax=Neomoorella glycerini TaxID=55779 RepID=A0A6I5ZPI9_9FIRM|nr:hypothetical protein [Moorella glycerini]QGP91708.1 hypothetical protein MGLY_10500 [Moorella glycerini]